MKREKRLRSTAHGGLTFFESATGEINSNRLTERECDPMLAAGMHPFGRQT